MHKIFVPSMLVLLALSGGAAQAQSETPVEGTDYIEIPNGKPLDPVEGKIVVEEFFNYICPACASFEATFEAWTRRQPDYVDVVHIPAAFRQDFLQYAKAYYAAESFGLVDETHNAVYAAIHRAHTLPSEGQRPDEEKIAEFYSKFGVSAEDFLAAMRSFEVDFKIRRAIDHMQRSQVSSTPSLVINGRYLVKGRTFQDMLDVADYLIEKEHQQ